VKNSQAQLPQLFHPLIWCWFVAGLSCVLFSGCKSTVVYAPETSDSDGIRYYESAPYLLVYSDGHGGLKWQIRYLPDQTRVMTASPVVHMSHTEMTLNFQNGILASSSTMGDSTQIPKALISAVQSALPLIAKAVAAAGQQPDGFPAPYLYKIIVNGSTVQFLGEQGDSKIQVPIPVNPLNN